MTAQTSPQYNSVLENNCDIVDTLNSTPGATTRLWTKYKEKVWSNICTEQTSNTLVTTALNRIKNDAKHFETFLTMLKDIAGLDLIVAKLEKARKLGCFNHNMCLHAAQFIQCPYK